MTLVGSFVVFMAEHMCSAVLEVLRFALSLIGSFPLIEARLACALFFVQAVTLLRQPQGPSKATKFSMPYLLSYLCLPRSVTPS